MTKKKENPEIRWHLTAAEKKNICRLSGKHVRATEIARQLHLTRNTVSRCLRASALPTKLVWPKARILELFDAGLSGAAIARKLRAPGEVVYAALHEFGKYAKDTSLPEREAAFVEDLKRRENFVMHLAKKYRLGSHRAYRLAHKVLGVCAFKCGPAQPPLSSDSPRTIDRIAAP